MKTVLETLNLTTNYLKEKGISQARRQAEELLCDALNVDRVKLYCDFERPLTEGELNLCRERLTRRSKGEPLQYIHGEVEFYRCKLRVNSAVLIPRQETEILVEHMIRKLEKQDLVNKTLWDVCCGSGCIGLALKKRFPELKVILSDLSPEALQVAKQNAEQNQLEVEFLQGDLLDPFKGQKTNYLVCNPPYIADHEWKELDKEVRNYEPRMALIAGVKGTEFYERLAQDLSAYLLPSGVVWFEIGHGQGEALKSLFQGFPWKSQKVEKDWSGQNRFFFLENE